MFEQPSQMYLVSYISMMYLWLIYGNIGEYIGNNCYIKYSPKGTHIFPLIFMTHIITVHTFKYYNLVRV